LKRRGGSDGGEDFGGGGGVVAESVGHVVGGGFRGRGIVRETTIEAGNDMRDGVGEVI